jgi:uncharacterized protein (TIGR03067 family)
VLELIYTFEGNKTPSPVRVQATFRIDPTKHPKQLSFTIIDEVGEKVVNNMIYAVEGDTLKLSLWGIFVLG